MARRATRWTRAQAREIVDELEASGQSMAEFGRQRGLNPERIRKWRTRFRREATEASPRIVELVARREATAEGGPAQYRRLKACVTGGFSTSIATHVSSMRAGPAAAIGSGRAADEVCTTGS